MTKSILIALSIYYALLAAFLIIAPLRFYEVIPGVSGTGPFNSHFARDVGFAFLVSAAGLFLGGQRNDRVLALLGAAFPVLHGLFHVVSLGHHSFPSVFVAVFDLAGTTGLAALTFWTALRLKRGVA